ncbi:MAG: hypothetical protein LC740_18645, partial [Actinobacteria bacterium]|nr:hypothetical protein [Actinomycetota bacterium]
LLLCGRLLLRLSLRGFYGDFPSDFLGDFFSHKLRDYLRRGLDCLLLLSVLAQRKEEHENDQHNYDEDERGHQRYSTATHSFPPPSSAPFPAGIAVQFIVEECI